MAKTTLIDRLADRTHKDKDAGKNKLLLLNRKNWNKRKKKK